MSVVSRRWMWVESMGVVVRRYIDFLILLTPLVSVLFAAASLLFVNKKKKFFILVLLLFCN